MVYQERSHLAVYFYFAVIVGCLWMAPSPAFLALSLALMMLHMDLYGAVLHVVLDHAPFIDLPIISPGCLEFQWHHAIPRDIVSKPFVEVVSWRVWCGHAGSVGLGAAEATHPGGSNSEGGSARGCWAGGGWRPRGRHRNQHKTGA